MTSPHTADLLKLLQATEEDLPINKAGRLSPSQVTRLTKERATLLWNTAAISLVVTVFFLWTFVNQFILAPQPGGIPERLFQACILFLPIGACTLFFLGLRPFTPVHWEEKTVLSIEGNIIPVLGAQAFGKTWSHLSSRSLYTIQISDQEFLVPRTLYYAIKENKRYRLFFIDPLKTIVSLEELT